MFYTKRRAFSAAVCAATAVSPFFAALPAAHAQAVTVTLSRGASGTYQLLRNGKPYFIKGAGGSASLPKLKDAGGNSIRTWGADNIGPLLDEAQKQGMTVCVGIWFGHKEHGFSYDNPKQVAEQQERVRQTVLKWKNHPAVLAWALGNEMEIGNKGPDVWKAVNDAAVLVKQLDPNHPTMTVVAEIGGDKVGQINALCPAIDIIGINSYGGAPSLPARYKAVGGTKPYVLTEFGPPGTWELPKKPWGATPEMTSTEKAGAYRRAYEGAVLNKPLCLGSYAFTWGNKQEATATWYGMLLPNGEKLAAVDTMTELWTGKPPKNRCPVLQSLHLAENADQVEPGSVIHATLAVSDPESDPLTVRWTLQKDDVVNSVGGDVQAKPPVFDDAIVHADDKGAEVRLPKTPGAYRLFAYVEDGAGGAAVANVPLFAKAAGGAVMAEPVKSETAENKSVESTKKPVVQKAALPLTLYAEPGKHDVTFSPAGWMGNAKAIHMDEASSDHPHTGATCLKVQYSAADGWGGVVWQSPAGDWGDKPGGLNLSGAKRLAFWARGEKGGETVTFEFGILDAKKADGDSATGKKEKAILTADWQPYAIDLSGLDLSHIKTGFAWIVAGENKPVTFFLDDIRYE